MFPNPNPVPQGLSIASSVPSRVMRRPAHPFHVRHRPYQIQPFFVAPVLAGETMKNLMFQTRCVTDPIKSPLIGWWLEHYFFYIPLRRLEGAIGTAGDRTVMEDMLLDLTAPLALESATSVYSYYRSGGYDFVRRMTELVTEEYFRDEGETATSYTIGGVPQAQIMGKSFLDSCYAASEIPEITLDQTPTADIPMSQLDSLRQTWEILRANKMTEMTYEDYIGTFGVRQSKQDPLAIELIRSSRQWSYPTNTVGTSGDDLGVPSSAVSWSVQERADKDRFFREPGFLFGVTVCRPKVYLSGQSSFASSMLTDALAWLPAIMKEQVETSIRKVAAGTGALKDKFAASDYVLDIRDLFVHGEQFLNVALDTGDANLVGLPSNVGNSPSRYAVSVDIDNLFVGAGETPAKNLVRQDGIVNVSVLGTQLDHT